jgi:hypothetical protein
VPVPSEAQRFGKVQHVFAMLYVPSRHSMP